MNRLTAEVIARPRAFDTLLGDSGAYIWTALTGWIPSDRSYFYGYLVRWLAVWPHSFGPLLLSQMLLDPGRITSL
jgi:hypothetical protein